MYNNNYFRTDVYLRCVYLQIIWRINSISISSVRGRPLALTQHIFRNSSVFPYIQRIYIYMIFFMCAYTMQYERFSPHIPPFSIVLTCIYLFTLAQCRNHIWNNSIFKIECAYYCINIYRYIVRCTLLKEQLGIYNVRIQCRNSKKKKKIYAFAFRSYFNLL